MEALLGFTSAKGNFHRLNGISSKLYQSS